MQARKALNTLMIDIVQIHGIDASETRGIKRVNQSVETRKQKMKTRMKNVSADGHNHSFNLDCPKGRSLSAGCFVHPWFHSSLGVTGPLVSRPHHLWRRSQGHFWLESPTPLTQVMDLWPDKQARVELSTQESQLEGEITKQKAKNFLLCLEAPPIRGKVKGYTKVSRAGLLIEWASQFPSEQKEFRCSC